MKDETKIVTVSVKSLFTVDANGVLTEVDSSAIVANLIIPDYVKEISSDKFFKDNTIIESVTMEGVEELSSGAFRGVTNLTTVTIGSKIKSVGGVAFALSKKITTIRIKAQNPPSIIGGNVFIGTPDDKTLIVPQGTKSAYENSDWKKYFENIVEE